MKKRTRPKPYWEMTTEELREATAQFDEEFVIDKARPLTKEERAWWERVRKKGEAGRKNGERTIPVHLDEELLGRCEALAKKLRISRDLLVARGLKAILAAHEEES